MKIPSSLPCRAGGVPVAAEVAAALDAPLDVVLVRKIGLPDHRELAAAAIVDGETPELVVNDGVLGLLGLDRPALDEEISLQLQEINSRRSLYFGNRERPQLSGRIVVVVDDGAATGATAIAALRALRKQEPSKLVLAVPVCPADTLKQMMREADNVVCLATPYPFVAVGAHYGNFPQVSDKEVIALLNPDNH